MDNFAQILKYVKSRIGDFKPEVGVILGSGLGEFADEIKAEAIVPYTEIEGFPTSTVSGHKGRFVFGYVEDVPVVIMQGRVHYYEGYPMADVVLPTRLMGMLGAKKIFLTNAAGGINEELSPGSLVVLRDHVSMFVPNPLRGANDPDEGERFPDMTEVYDRFLRKTIEECADRAGVPITEGVYCQLSGPSYESPFEIKILAQLGVDVVGMSTVMEAIAAKHMGMKLCGISLVTNMAAGINPKPLSHEEVKFAGKEAANVFSSLVAESIREIREYLNTLK